MGGMLDHVSIQCADLAASAAFYDAVLAPLGGRRVLDFGEVIGYGVPPMPDFWIGRQATGEGFRESHLAFTAPDRAAVHAFFEAATARGAEVLHQPRVWPEGHDCDGRPGSAGRLQHPTMTAMHTIEGADSSDTFVGRQLLWAVGDLHSRASASSAGMK